MPPLHCPFGVHASFAPPPPANVTQHSCDDGSHVAPPHAIPPGPVDASTIVPLVPPLLLAPPLVPPVPLDPLLPPVPLDPAEPLVPELPPAPLLDPLDPLDPLLPPAPPSSSIVSSRVRPPHAMTARTKTATDTGFASFIERTSLLF